MRPALARAERAQIDRRVLDESGKGWYAVVREDEVVDLGMSVEEAFKVIISGGIVSPSPLAPASLPSFPERQLETSLAESKLQVLPLEEA